MANTHGQIGGGEMAWSIPLVRIRGIPVKVHLTFLLILWVALGWGDGDSARALFALAAIGLLFTCVALHELGHALEAQRLGVPVRDITLLPIGGIARLEIPDRPDQELRIALAGPLVSVALAGLIAAGVLMAGRPLTLGLVGLRVPLVEPSVVGLASYLASANLALALFNLLPAFPLDGGRILRALLALRGDYLRATSIAVVVGQVFAGGLGLVGLLTGNVVLILVALFVWLGAEAEGRVARARAAVEDAPLRARSPTGRATEEVAA
jgi:stage IV sporulation protein FB